MASASLPDTAHDTSGENEQNFRALVENANDGILIAAGSGQHVFANQRAAEIMSYTVEELLHTSFHDLAHPDDLPVIADRFRRRLAGDAITPQFETTIVTKQGQHKPIELTSARTTWQGQPADLVIVRDISQRKEMQAALQRDARLNAAVSELLASLLSTGSIEETSALVLDKAKELTDSTLGFAGYIDPIAGYLVAPTMTREIWDACNVADKDNVFTQFRGLWGWVLQHGQPLLTNTPAQDGRSQGTPAGHLSIQRFLSAPALLADRVVGQIALANPSGDYDEHDLTVVERLAALFALAIQHHQTQDVIRRNAVRQESLAAISLAMAGAGVDLNAALAVAVEQTALILGDVCVLRLLSEDGAWLRPVALHHPNPEARAFIESLLAAASHRAEEGINGQVMSSGQSVLLPVVPQEQIRAQTKPEYWPYLERFGIHSLILAPIRAGGQVIGTLGVSRDQPGRPYGREDQEFLQDLADRVALALTNAQLFQENIRQREELEQRVAERTQAVEYSRARFRSIFQQSPVAIELFDVGGRLVDANHACLELFGIDSVEAIRGFQLFEDPNIPAMAKQQLQAGQSVRFETEFDFDLVRQLGLYATHKQGRRAIECVISPWLPENDDQRGFLVHVQDITERLQTMNALRSSQQMLQLILDTAPQRIFWKDTTSNYLGCNRAFARDAGLADPSEIIGKNDFDLIWRDNAPLYRADDALVMSSGQPKIGYEEPQARPKGGVRWLSSNKVPLRNAQGAVIGILGIYEDISERRQAAKAIERRNRELSILYAIHRTASQSRDLDEILYTALAALREILLFEKAGVLLLQPDGDTLAIRVQSGLSEDDAKRLDQIQVGQGIAGRAALERRPVVMGIDDYPDPERLVGLRQEDIHSIAGVPLLASGELVGVLNLATSGINPFEDDDLALLTVIGQQLGQVVSNAQLYEQLQQELAERQRIESALRRSEANLATVIENSDQRIWSVDRSYRLLVFNADFARGMQQLLGRPVQIGESALDASLSPQVAEYWRSRYDRALAGEAFRFEDKSTIYPDDAFIECSLCPIRDVDGEVTGAACSFRYITERKLAEIALRDSEERFRTIFEQAAAGMATVSPTGRLLRVNQRLCQLLGYSESELLARGFQDVTHPADLDLDLGLFQLMLSGAIPSYSMEKRYLRPDGSLIWANLTVSALRDSSGQIQYFISVVQDISERKTMEEELRQARAVAEERRQVAEDASRVKSAFLANMSHELRTPLNAILGFSMLTARNPAMDQETRQNMDAIVRNGEHLLTLINDILELSRIEAGRAGPRIVAFDLHDLLADVMNMLHLRAADKGLALNLEIAAAVPRQVLGDQGKLRQVLINLLSNAVKFTSQGSVQLRADITDADMALGLVKTTFAVEDSGQGIAPSELSALFDAFVQTESGRRLGEGTGLGLAISHEYVDLMGGELQVRSQVNQGSVFWFSIPLQIAVDFEQPDHSASLEQRSAADSALPVLHLVGLPAGWLKQVRLAAVAADSRRLGRLIDQLAVSRPDLAGVLKQQMGDFAYEVILAAVDRALAAD